jgi:hypothetical protein
MSCPICGFETLPEQKFCRSCGASLQVTTQPLADRATISQIERTSTILSKDQMQRVNTLMRWGLIIMFVGAATGVIGSKLIHAESVTVVGILVSLAGMLLTVYPYLSPSRRTKHDSSSNQEVPTQSQPRNLHESRVDYLPSVTERTTDLLKDPEAIPNRKEREA